MFNALIQRRFWCYQGDSSTEVFEYVKGLHSIRFAREKQLFPNMECIPIDPSKKAKYFEFTRPQLMQIEDFKFKVPPLEFEILYKEIVLAGKKDISDAKHLRTLFSDILRTDKFKEFQPIIEGELE